MFYSHVKMVNKIYERTSFSGITGINFIIQVFVQSYKCVLIDCSLQRTTIYNPETCTSGKSENPFCEDAVDVSGYLNLNSISNHSAFCLAYSLTYRDFDSGTLGLAWVASPQPNTAGGICQVLYCSFVLYLTQPCCCRCTKNIMSVMVGCGAH